ncbi:MAG: MATE family efflux transporter [Eubacteriales bacterium]|nr:MATE family efflux transporter [Eubacteriales bacterium]
MMFSNKQLKQLIVPLLVEQLLAVTVGLADSVMIAGVGEAAVSGVSLVDTVMVLLINIFSALATGGAVVAGHYLGQKREEAAGKAADQLVFFTVCLSLVITVLVYGGQNLILDGIFGKIEPDVMANARTYLLIVTASIPFIALYNAGAALFRAMGNSKVSMKTSILMNGINICGNALLIFGLHLGVAGAAIPTLVSRMAAAVMILFLLRKPDQQIHLSKHFVWKFEKHTVKKILHIGVPNGLENSMFQLGKILVLSLVSGFGTASIAANAVSNTIAMFQILPGMALGMAMLSVAAQCVGASAYDQAKYYTKKLLGLTYLCMLFMNVLVVLLLPLIIRAYNLSDVTAEITKQIIWYHAACCVTIWPCSFFLPNTLRAANDVKFTMCISIASMWIFRIGFSYLLGQYLGLGVFGVWVAMTIDWLFRAICFVTRYLRGKWQYIK